jgi:hypothetical protein
MSAAARLLVFLAFLAPALAPGQGKSFPWDWRNDQAIGGAETVATAPLNAEDKMRLRRALEKAVQPWLSEGPGPRQRKSCLASGFG